MGIWACPAGDLPLSYIQDTSLFYFFLERDSYTLPRLVSLAIFLPQPPEEFRIVGMCQQAQLHSPLNENLLPCSSDETILTGVSLI